MESAQNWYRPDLRDIRFVLFEQFRLGDLLGQGRFSDWGEEEVNSVLTEAARYATTVAGPLNAVGDRQGCRLEGGKVFTPDGFKEGYERLYAAGLKSLSVAPEYGGAYGPKSLALLVTEITAGANEALDMYGGLTLGAAEVIEAFGNEAQKHTYCEKMFSGAWAGTMCLTEPQAGSDVGGATTSARRLADGSYGLRGTKIFISGGDHQITDNIVHMVLARIDGAPPGTKGLSLFIVPKFKADGTANDVTVGSIEHKMGLNGSATCVLNFGENDNCVGELVGGVEHQGIKQMFKMMNFARIAVGCQSLGLASSSFLNALAYAKERKQGPRFADAKDPEAPRVPIVQHADVRRTLMDMKAKVYGLRAMIAKAGYHDDARTVAADPSKQEYHQGQIELLTPLIKAYGSDQAFRIAEQAVQIYGGSGFTRDYPVEQACRDSKVFAIYEGTNHIQALDLVGRKLGQDRGAHTQAFFRDVGEFVQQHSVHPALGASVATLGSATEAISSLVVEFAKWAKGPDAVKIPLVATQFLELMSELCVGWLLLQGAVIAYGQKTNPDSSDHAFYKGKVAAAEYFSQFILPTLPARVATLRNVSTSVLDVEEAALG
jgi:alkylation response protein AidB-like acyl-CoA dehydrogenase